MSADIYTKGFAEAAAWQLATRLINHLDPDLFWGGRRMSKALVMPTEHKGGVTFDYWVSNPWLNHTIRPTKPAAPGLAPGGQTPVTPNTTADGTMAAAVAADDDSVMEDKGAKTTCKSDLDGDFSGSDYIVDTNFGGDGQDPSVNPTSARSPWSSEAGASPGAGVDDSAGIGTANPSATASLLSEVPVPASPQSPVDRAGIDDSVIAGTAKPSSTIQSSFEVLALASPRAQKTAPSGMDIDIKITTRRRPQRRSQAIRRQQFRRTSSTSCWSTT
jgi:hypothetical protein